MTTNTETRTEIREIVRDTTIVIPPDSAWFRALLECDSAGNVLMRELETVRGQNASIGAVNLKSEPDGKTFNLRIDFIVDSLQLEIKRRDKVIETYKNNQVTKTETITVTKPYPWWAKTLMWLGGGFLLLIIMAVIFTIIKFIR